MTAAPFSKRGERHRGEILQVHLVHNADVRRHDTEIPKRRLSPSEQRVAFLVALELEQRVVQKSARGAILVHLYGVVDDQVGGNERVGEVRIAAERLQRIAHGGEVYHAGHAGEVLKQHARRHEADFARPGPLPFRDEFDVFGFDRCAVFVAEQVLEQHPDGVGKAADAGETGLFERPQGVDLVVAAP